MVAMEQFSSLRSNLLKRNKITEKGEALLLNIQPGCLTALLCRSTSLALNLFFFSFTTSYSLRKDLLKTKCSYLRGVSSDLE